MTDSQYSLKDVFEKANVKYTDGIQKKFDTVLSSIKTSANSDVALSSIDDSVKKFRKFIKNHKISDPKLQDELANMYLAKVNEKSPAQDGQPSRDFSIYAWNLAYPKTRFETKLFKEEFNDLKSDTQGLKAQKEKTQTKAEEVYKNIEQKLTEKLTQEKVFDQDTKGQLLSHFKQISEKSTIEIKPKEFKISKEDAGEVLGMSVNLGFAVGAVALVSWVGIPLVPVLIPTVAAASTVVGFGGLYINNKINEKFFNKDIVSTEAFNKCLKDLDKSISKLPTKYQNKANQQSEELQALKEANKEETQGLTGKILKNIVKLEFKEAINNFSLRSEANKNFKEEKTALKEEIQENKTKHRQAINTIQNSIRDEKREFNRFVAKFDNIGHQNAILNADFAKLKLEQMPKNQTEQNFAPQKKADRVISQKVKQEVSNTVKQMETQKKQNAAKANTPPTKTRQTRKSLSK